MPVRPKRLSCGRRGTPRTRRPPRRSSPTAPRPVEPAGVWDQLAECESGGNWSINSGNGYHGGLQFLGSTWRAYGGGEFAEHADMASRDEQIVVAERLRADVGFGAWPSCSRRLGLR